VKRVIDWITTPDRELLVLSSSLGMTVPTQPLAVLADTLCHRRRHGRREIRAMRMMAVPVRSGGDAIAG
jgi:hypothetical protein